MGLSSVTSVALSGMQAATTMLDVAANNLANSQTPGFKASRVQFATQPYQTLAPGFGPSGARGGRNPAQIGLGVAVAAIEIDPSQGSIDQNQPLPLLALDGEGMFILEGSADDHWYTRAGQFHLNAAGELTTPEGYRVLGYALNERGEIDSSHLAPLTIHLGQQVPTSSGGAAQLQGYTFGSDGRVLGRYSDGVERTLGQIRIARFPNGQGLYQRASNLYAATPAAGVPLETNPGVAGAGSIHTAALERSNVDIGRELINLALARTQFRANWLVAVTAQSFWDELLLLSKRNDR